MYLLFLLNYDEVGSRDRQTGQKQKSREESDSHRVPRFLMKVELDYTVWRERVKKVDMFLGAIGDPGDEAVLDPEVAVHRS
jgi:hypothetical protein